MKELNRDFFLWYWRQLWQPHKECFLGRCKKPSCLSILWRCCIIWYNIPN